jgi:hypothetical protein
MRLRQYLKHVDYTFEDEMKNVKLSRQLLEPCVRSILGSMPEFANIWNESMHWLPTAAQFPPRVGQPYISGAPVSQDFHNNSQVVKRLLSE